MTLSRWSKTKLPMLPAVNDHRILRHWARPKRPTTHGLACNPSYRGITQSFCRRWSHWGYLQTRGERNCFGKLFWCEYPSSILKSDRPGVVLNIMTIDLSPWVGPCTDNRRNYCTILDMASYPLFPCYICTWWSLLYLLLLP
jgi:hypothetical protein